MTTNRSRKPSLDEVLEAIAANSEPPRPAELRIWIDQHPQFKVEIINFATDWVEMEASKVSHEVTQEDVNVVVNRTMSRVQQELHTAQRSASITDLSAEIKAAGYDIDSFQRAIGIDRSILSCLISRLIRPATLPFTLVRGIAEALHRELEAVRTYFRLPPLAQEAYKSRSKPTVKQVDFGMLLDTAELSGADQARWRAEAPDPALQE